MIEAKVIWTDNHRFLGQAGSSHGIVVDGDSKTASSPMELVLIGLCACTGYDVASILARSASPLPVLRCGPRRTGQPLHRRSIPRSGWFIA